MRLTLIIAVFASFIATAANAVETVQDAGTGVQCVAATQDATATVVPASPTDKAVVVAQRCCKVCRKGKACGNSCISRSKTCHQPPGCACNGY